MKDWSDAEKFFQLHSEYAVKAVWNSVHPTVMII